jgi:hypothetical protein
MSDINPESEHEHESGVRLNVHLPESQRGGIWANFALVHHSEHEFTIDFMRLDYSSVSEDRVMQGIVVARVGVSPLFVRQLISALEDNWAKYAKKAMPREVYGDEPGSDSG